MHLIPELRSELRARPGGVMTDEVGAMTGDLELITGIAPDGALTVQVRYVGALDICTVSGSTGARLRDVSDHAPVHELLRGVLESHV